jgi:hypothetical protein
MIINWLLHLKEENQRILKKMIKKLQQKLLLQKEVK